MTYAQYIVCMVRFAEMEKMIWQLKIKRDSTALKMRIRTRKFFMGWVVAVVREGRAGQRRSLGGGCRGAWKKRGRGYKKVARTG